ncbi:histidine kinase [Saccharopolyspora sp. NPDC047091]|uniref:sensor histidine kinase n=1 Tax=Saccharopolyspora sp. NPDC047091 TaxID=3155924 RepID=UPI0033EF6275
MRNPPSAPTGSAHRPLNPLNPLVAAGCGLVSLALFLSIPLAGAADPTLGDLPAPGEGRWWLLGAVLLVQAVALTWANRRPEVVLPLVAGVPLVLAWFGPNAAFSTTAVALIAAVYLAVVARTRWPRIVLPGAWLLEAVAQACNEVRDEALALPAALLAGAAQALVVVGLPVLAGSVIAAQRDAREAREQEARALRREQGALLEAAVSQQRAALSRELHDIAAHHLSGIALMAAVIDRRIDSDPDAARQAAREIREQSTAVLDDLRRLVGLLREGHGADAPVAALDAVPGLVAQRRAAGAEIDLVLPGSGSGEVGPLAQLVAYRAVQESLANAAAHAPGARCAVEIGARGPDRLAVVVRNGAPATAGAGPGGGFGLLGMAERAQLVGADLDYGPTSGGGWEVRLLLPREDPTPAALAPPIPEAPA